MRKIFRLLYWTLAILTLGFSLLMVRILLNARRFEKSMDINVDKLDEMALFKNKYVNFYTHEMRDFKLGSFFGTLTCEMSEMRFERKEYDLTVVAEAGNVVLILPEDVAVEVTTPQSYTNVVDDRVSLPKETLSLLSITAYLPMGLLILKNPD